LSLANVLLWLHAIVWRREMLSLSELPFVEAQGKVTLHVRVGANDAAGKHGVVQRLDRSDEGGVPSRVEKRNGAFFRS
jgi:hypothetical protein